MRSMKTLSTPLDLPDDVQALKAHIGELELALAERDATIESLHEQVRMSLTRRFTPSSERVLDAQLGLFNEAESLDDGGDEEPAPCAGDASQSDTVVVPAHERRRGKRAPLPANLPRVDVVHALSDEERHCPHDGTELEVFDEQTCEQLDIVPAKIQVLHHRRLKYRCPCCRKHLVTAPMPAQPIPKSQASPGLLAYVATAKFVDALPLYRQSTQFERIKAPIPKQTLARWMVRCGQVVQPLINFLRDELLSQTYIHVDESTLQVLKEPGRDAQSKSYMWVQVSGERERPVVLFDYDPSRSGEVPKRLLSDFRGYLHTDGYAGYNALVRDNQLMHVQCMAHARRFFVDGLKALGLKPSKLPAKTPQKAKRLRKGLEFIRTLYVIERRLRDKPPDERQQQREQYSRPVIDKLYQWVEKTQTTVNDKSKLGRGLAYLHNHRDGLTRFIEDGRLEIDNNRAENAIRPFTVGRKNFLFADTVAGANASANLYSLIETAKANGHEPYAYLRRVLTELPKATTVEHVEALLPWNITATELP